MPIALLQQLLDKRGHPSTLSAILKGQDINLANIHHCLKFVKKGATHYGIFNINHSSDYVLIRAEFNPRTRCYSNYYVFVGRYQQIIDKIWVRRTEKRIQTDNARLRRAFLGVHNLRGSYNFLWIHTYVTREDGQSQRELCCALIERPSRGGNLYIYEYISVDIDLHWRSSDTQSFKDIGSFANSLDVEIYDQYLRETVPVMNSCSWYPDNHQQQDVETRKLARTLLTLSLREDGPGWHRLPLEILTEIIHQVSDIQDDIEEVDLSSEEEEVERDRSIWSSYGYEHN